MTFKAGDRVQLTRLFLRNRQRADATYFVKGEDTVGIFVRYVDRRPRHVISGTYCIIDWITHIPAKPLHRQAMVCEHNLEPYGTRR